MSNLWDMKLTAPTKSCYISDRVACTVKKNIKETFMRNHGFLQILMW